MSLITKNLLADKRFLSSPLLVHNVKHLYTIRPKSCFSSFSSVKYSNGNDGSSNGCSTILSQIGFESYYRIRSNIESLIQDMSKKQLPRLNYDFLMKYKPATDTKFSTNQQYIMNIQYMNMLLVMTCQQLDLIQKIPYIVLLNPKIELTHSLYLKTLQSLLSFNYPYDLYDQNKMITIMEQFLNDHEDTLLTLSTGLQEVLDHNSKFNSSISYESLITQFLNKHLLIRIKMKLIATHYLKLMEQQNNNNNNSSSSSSPVARTFDKQIGILDSQVNVNKLIKHNFDFVIDMCHLQYDPALLPELNVTSVNHEGSRSQRGKDVVVPMVPIIFEYIMTEILKNSVRASIENSMKLNRKSSGSLNSQIDIQIYKERKEYSNEVVVKISDQGGGIQPSIEPRIFDYSYTTLHNNHIRRNKKNSSDRTDILEEDFNLSGDVQPANNNIAGMGFGLPLCKLYLELFGGKLEIQNLYGYGTDAYLTIPLPEWRN